MPLAPMSTIEGSPGSGTAVSHQATGPCTLLTVLLSGRLRPGPSVAPSPRSAADTTSLDSTFPSRIFSVAAPAENHRCSCLAVGSAYHPSGRDPGSGITGRV